ncbi:MAG: hypothetical protein K2I66_04005, partial [Bacteroidales bacterium]|nr:hypothetical protein [Bacteroidales bacterium]
MQREDLLSIYEGDARLKPVLARIDARPQGMDGDVFVLKGLVGSGQAVVAQVISQHFEENQLFILADREKAAYFCNDLEKLSGENPEGGTKAKRTLFYPSSYKHPYDTEKVDNANVLTRTEVLEKLRSGQKGLRVVTYPEALSEKVINTVQLTSMAVRIHVNENLSQDFLSEFFDQYHFRQVEFVASPGEYALRGGIVDVFSFSDELPFRIEFDDDKV